MAYYPDGDKSFWSIEIDPKLAVAWYNKGVALKVLGRTSEAKAAWAKAKELGL